MNLLILPITRVLFMFSSESEFIYLYTFTLPLQQTLKQNHNVSQNCCSVKNMSKHGIQMAFKRVTAWKRIIRGHVNRWFVSIKFIRTFLKFPFLISLFKQFPLHSPYLDSKRFQLYWKNCPNSIYTYHYTSIISLLFFFCFFPHKGN